MRRLVFLVLVLGLVGFVCAGEKLVGLNEKDFRNPVEVVVKMQDSIGVRAFDGDFKEEVSYEVVKVDSKGLDDLLDNPDVVGVYSRNYIRAFMGQAVGIVNSTASNKLLVDSLNLTGTGQTVCIIDSGINFSHPDLVGKNVSCVVDCFGKACVENCSVGDNNGHGTHVAGIVAASGGLTGIAPNVSLIGVKILGSDGGGSGDDDDVNNAIDYCVSVNADIISMSLGTVTLYDSVCDDAGGLASWRNSVNAATSAGIVVVVASGNDANFVGISAPACLSNAIPVGDSYDANVGGLTWGGGTCTDATTFVDKIVCHANRNSLVKLFAPGALINSTRNTGGYVEQGGTSMAAPMVSGAIAILKQYLNASGQSKTTEEIENIFNETGVLLNDSGNSNLTFSRIDVYEALISVDATSPNVTLVSPVDGHVNSSLNQSFVCNLSDWQLKNVTFEIWNSSGDLVNSSSANVSGVQNSSSFSLENMAEGEYNWSCFGYDVKNNLGIVSANFSLTVGGIEVSLNSPANESYTNVNTSSFNCSATSESAYELSNMSFRIWNSSNDLVYNETKNISGFENVSIFNYTFLYDDNYLWECVALNNNSEEGDGVNYSLTYDSTAPNVTLTSLPSSETSNSISKDFGFNVSDENIANCSLIVNDIVVLTNSSVDVSVGQLFSRTFTPGTYAWNINCSDLAGNVNSSVENSFVITAVPSSGGGGGGGGSSSSSKVFVALVDNLFSDNGYTQVLKVKEKISFSANSGSHSLSVLKIGSDYVSILIQSEPVELNLSVGQEEKFNLSSVDYYDLYVRLNSISGGLVNITVKRIFELVEDESFVDSIEVSEADGLVGDEVSSDEKREYFSWIIVVLILIVVVFGSLGKKKKLKREKTRKKHGKQNKKVKAKAKRSR